MHAIQNTTTGAFPDIQQRFPEALKRLGWPLSRLGDEKPCEALDMKSRKAGK